MPLAEKISLPEGYGKTTERLSWESVQAQLEEAKQYWLATNRADGSPHLVPLDGLWVAHNTRRWLEANPGRDLPPNMYNVVHGMYTTPFTELMAGDAPNDLTLLAALNPIFEAVRAFTPYEDLLPQLDRYMAAVTSAREELEQQQGEHANSQSDHR